MTRNHCLGLMLFHVLLLYGSKLPWNVCPKTTSDFLYFFSYFFCHGPIFLLGRNKILNPPEIYECPHPVHFSAQKCLTMSEVRGFNGF
ncbi:hypothetical protein VNO80_17165 [Phaseolus coccineus]|uniref:Secreted protein n=1 Tax=Phaseolus coccineus TaxID=3886 RepID=A0AAN9MSX5_PHACN